MLEEMALRRYVSALRSGNATPYECYRFFEASFRYRESDAPHLLRTAVLTLLKRDPLFLITSSAYIAADLSVTDIEECVSGWSLDGEGALRSLLEGHLWIMCSRGPNGVNREYARRALKALEDAAAEFASELKYLELYAEALLALHDPAFLDAVEAQIDATPAEWRAHPISLAMREMMRENNYEAYRSLRGRWAKLPKNAHICECQKNYVANMDGLVALEDGSRDLGLFLREAADVRGCPHLNSGAASFHLARRLVERGELLDQVLTYLDRMDAIQTTPAAADLRKQIEAALQ